MNFIKKREKTDIEYHFITYAGYAIGNTLSEVLQKALRIRYINDTSWALIFTVNPSEKRCRSPDDRICFFPAIQNSKLIGMVHTEPFPVVIDDKSCQYICKDSRWFKMDNTEMLHYKIVKTDEYNDEYKLVLKGREDDEDYCDTSKASTNTKERKRLLKEMTITEAEIHQAFCNKKKRMNHSKEDV